MVVLVQAGVSCLTVNRDVTIPAATANPNVPFIVLIPFRGPALVQDPLNTGAWPSTAVPAATAGRGKNSATTGIEHFNPQRRLTQDFRWGCRILRHVSAASNLDEHQPGRYPTYADRNCQARCRDAAHVSVTARRTQPSGAYRPETEGHPGNRGSPSRAADHGCGLAHDVTTRSV